MSATRWHTDEELGRLVGAKLPHVRRVVTGMVKSGKLVLVPNVDAIPIDGVGVCRGPKGKGYVLTETAVLLAALEFNTRRARLLLGIIVHEVCAARRDPESRDDPKLAKALDKLDARLGKVFGGPTTP